MTTAARSELRRAFSDGAYAHGASKSWAEDAAKHAYPAPTATRAREVKTGDLVYRITDGKVEVRWLNSVSWTLSAVFVFEGDQLRIIRPTWPTVQDITTVVDLIKQPTETVEVEA